MGDPTSGLAAAALRAQGWWRPPGGAGLADLGVGALRAARRVFALDETEKRRYAFPQRDWNIGWRPASREDRPSEVWQVHGIADAGTWPQELAADAEVLHRLLSAAVQASGCLVGLVADDDTAPDVEHSVVRLLHYSDGGNQFPDHTDLGLMTVFAAESAAALQLRDAEGRWVDIACPVFAAGELLQRHTAEAVVAGHHRVVSTGRPRYAVAVFVHPRPEWVVASGPDRTPLTAEQFFQEAMAVYTRTPSPSAAPPLR